MTRLLGVATVVAVALLASGALNGIRVRIDDDTLLAAIALVLGIALGQVARDGVR